MVLTENDLERSTAVIIPEGYGQATLLFTGAAVPTGAAMTFGFRNLTPVTAAAAANSIYNIVGTSDLLDRCTPTLVLSACRVKLGPNETGAQAEVSGVEAGDSAGDSMPNVAALISKNTALGGRKGKGRMFLPGIIEADMVNGGTLSSAALTALQPKVDAFLTLLNTNSLPMYLLHNEDTDVPTIVTSLTLQATLATQRRRLRR